MSESVDDYKQLFSLTRDQMRYKDTPYRECMAEISHLVRGLGIRRLKALRGMYDPEMSVACGHPCLNICRLEDELMERYPDYTDNTSMNEWLQRHDPGNIDLWKFYLGVFENGEAKEDYRPTAYA